jgi:hypothetical protein
MHTTGLILSLDVAVSIYFICYVLVIKNFFSFKMHILPLFFILLIAVACVVGFNTVDMGMIYGLFIKAIFISLFSLSCFYAVMGQKEKSRLVELIRSRRLKSPESTEK